MNSQLLGSRSSQPGIWNQLVEGRALGLLLACIYITLLALLYRYELSTYWRYMGFAWQPNTVKLAIGITTMIGAALILPGSTSTRSLLLQLSAYFHFFPSVLLFGLADIELNYFVTVLFGTMAIWLFAFVPTKRIIVSHLSWNAVMMISLASCFVMLMALAFFSGLSNFNLDFSKVYELRAEASDRLPRLFGYLRPLTTKVFLPIFILLAFTSGNLFWRITAVLVAVAFLGLTQHKIILFASIATVGLYLALISTSRAHIVGLLAVSLLSVCALDAFILSALTERQSASWITSVVVRRATFIPVLLDSFYLEFFSKEPFYFWSQSKLGLGFAERPFELNAPHVIGDEFFGSESTSANTGFVGAGYANAGIVGVVIYGVVIGLVIALLNSYGKALGHPFVAALAFTLIMGAYRGGDLTTIFMTHGLGFLLVFLWFAPRTPLLSQKV